MNRKQVTVSYKNKFCFYCNNGEVTNGTIFETNTEEGIRGSGDLGLLYDVSLGENMQLTLQRHDNTGLQLFSTLEERQCRFDKDDYNCQITKCDNGPEIEQIIRSDNICYFKYHLHLAFFMGNIARLDSKEHMIVAEFVKCIGNASPGLHELTDYKLTNYQIKRRLKSIRLYGVRIEYYHPNVGLHIDRDERT